MQVLNKQLWNDLKRINREVNSNIKYKTDSELYGKIDFWTVVEGKGAGDCDDYALTKIMRLVEETDWQRENLSIGVCRVDGVGHAVCIARTDRGDFVLDNNYNVVRSYNKKPFNNYQWLMMEDYPNKKWVKILS